MQLLIARSTTRQTVAGKRLSRALHLEAYFRRMLEEHWGEQALHQWDASRRMVWRALHDCARQREQQSITFGHDCMTERK